MTYTHSLRQHHQFALVGALLSLALLPFGVYADSNKDKGSNGLSGTGVEINIGSNGGVLVRGAKVTSVSSSTVNANTSIGASVLNWIVKTDGSTEFVTHGGANTGLSGIAVGDTISFRGTLDQAVSGLTVNAKIVKDWSQVETKRTLEGVVGSINATLGSFTILKGGSTTTVQTSSSTEWEDGLDSFADLLINTTVKVKGFFNASTSVMTAQSVELEDNDDDSDDDRWGKEDRKEWREWIKSKIWLNLR